MSFSISKSVCRAVVRCVEAVELPKLCCTELLCPAAAVWLQSFVTSQVDVVDLLVSWL